MGPHEVKMNNFRSVLNHLELILNQLELILKLGIFLIGQVSTQQTAIVSQQHQDNGG